MSRSLAGTRVLKKHKRAVAEALAGLAACGGDSDTICHFIAEAVLTAYDDQMKYVVVTDDHVVFGPYSTREAAYKAIERGACAHRHGQRAMVLPMRAAPGVRTAKVVKVPAPTEQLPLWDVYADEAAAMPTLDD